MKTNAKRAMAAAMALTCASLLPGSGAFAAGETTALPLGTYEAEELDVTESIKVWQTVYETEIKGDYSGEGFVYQQNGTITANIRVEEEGMYSISARCAQILSQEGRTGTLSVNGEKYTYILPYMDAWTDVDLGVFRFKEGVNTIVFEPQYGYAEYDTITFKEASLPKLDGSAVPCDPKATPETKSLMAYLHSVYGKHVLSGQQEIYGGGHTVQTNIRYDADTDTCSDGSKTYTIDKESYDVAEDGSRFPWHCTDETGRVYDYSTQNRCYTYVNYEQEIEYIQELTGQTPAVRGFDFMNYNPLYGWNDGSTDRAIKWAKEQNGIVTVCWHINLPKDFTAYEVGEPVDWNLCSYKNNDSFSVKNAVIEGTKENEYLNLAIKDLAEQFQKLQDAGVPAIFRPFHEAEGNGGVNGEGAWFWWAQEGAEAYNNLWKYLYNALTEDYGLHNLIWEQNLYAWSPDSAKWYTGDDYVDIVGFDKYNTVYNRHDGKTSGPNEDAESKIFYSLVDYVDNKKMVSMPENSTVPSVENMTIEQAYWLYFCIWYDNGQENFVSGDDFQDAETLKKVYQSDLCTTLEELPADLYTGFSGENPTEGDDPTDVPTENPDAVVYGDVDDNGEVEIGDVISLCKASMGTYTLTDKGIRNADVNLDGTADTTDAAFILQSLIGLINLPVDPLEPPAASGR